MPPKPVVVATPELNLDLADRCEEVAADVTEKANALFEANRRYAAVRAEVNKWVTQQPGANPISDGPPPQYPWEVAIRDLQRAVRQKPALPAPRERWRGLRSIEHANREHRRLNLLRLQKRTRQEQAELDALNRGRGVGPSVFTQR
jgi:hypothetical protein